MAPLTDDCGRCAYEGLADFGASRDRRPLDLPCVGASSLTHDTAPPLRDAESVATIVGSGLPAGHGPGGEGACPIRVDSGSLRR